MPKNSKKKRTSNRQNKETPLATAPRNPYSDHPLMRKGGVHEKSKSAERSKARREIKKLARDWSSQFKNINFLSWKNLCYKNTFTQLFIK